MNWDNIICTFASTDCAFTVDHKLREFSNKRWEKLHFTPLANTSGSDFLQLLNIGGTATSVYLKAIQAIALETGLITHPILPKKTLAKTHPQTPSRHHRGRTSQVAIKPSTNVNKSQLWQLNNLNSRILN